MKKLCKIHHIEFDYICPKCLEPFLIHTNFSSLDEIREYQKNNASKVNLSSKHEQLNLAGIIKSKIFGDLVYSIFLYYDIGNNEILDVIIKSTKPLFTKYFPSVLFLNQTRIYLDLVKNIKKLPDLYIINASGQIHPYLYGAACDFGLKTDIPVIGYTKRLLFGEIKNNEIKLGGNIKGVYFHENIIGYAIPKPNSKKFLYISVGNNITLITALKLFLKIDIKIFSFLGIELNNYITQRKKS